MKPLARTAVILILAIVAGFSEDGSRVYARFIVV